MLGYVWDGFPILQAVSKDTESQGLHSCDGFLLRLAIRHDTWEFWDFGEPTPIGFAFNFDG